ncbi:MAG TPA: phosphomevalonate kinase [Tepidimicrobium sp.]|nr:phosphomevalonate kinase [Tepidimicrobium sp.]
MIETFAPGKLFIAGEYAVLEPGHTAILVAVNRFIKVSLLETSDEGRITSYGGESISWLRKDGQVFSSQPNKSFAYVLSAINTVEKYTKELGKKLKFYKINIFSQLESKDGIKYGLGSSAAVTVATIKALCIYYEIPISDMELFKLSALASLAVNANSSCADIGTSVFGGWIAFTTFDRDWVLRQVGRMSIAQLLEQRWPKLSIETLVPPTGLKLAVGWTGRPASTTNLVSNIYKRQVDDSIAYEDFLKNSDRCVKDMIYAFKKWDIQGIKKQIEINRKLLAHLSDELALPIETPLLTSLCDTAIKLGGAAKSSGAGGGDCGIVIFQDDRYLPQLIYEWEKVGITYLPVKVAYY